MTWNRTNSSEADTCEVAPSWFAFMITANLISAVLGGIGNSLVCVAVWKTASLHSTINYYMASLAIADLIATVLCQPLMITVVIARETGALDCESTLDKVYRAVGNFSCAASFFLLCCIGLERLLAILRPLTTIRTVNYKRFVVLVAGSWLVALLYSIFRVTVSRRATSYFSAVSFATGYIWIVLCYIIILVLLALQAKRQANITASERTQRKNEKKITVTMVLVIACFTTMWLPFFCFRLSSNSTLNSGYVYELAITMAFCNSAFNPIIYSFRSRKYRKAFKAILFKKYRLAARGTTRTATHSSASRKTSSNLQQRPLALQSVTSLPLQPISSSRSQDSGSEDSLHNVV